MIQVENEKDFDTLLNNILTTGYYDASYFESHIDYKRDEVKFDSLFLSSILKFLKPKTLLELGCGRGDVLFLLGIDHKIRVRGIELSLDIVKKVWPILRGKVDFGDILKVCTEYYKQGITFDTFCAFDLWEHIHPQKLHDYINSITALAEKDTIFFFSIPAFGNDRVFGELFPLEFEENRKKFNKRLPFNYLIVESREPLIPVKGHLICAHSDWWEKQFEQHGLIRSEVLEGNIHTCFDDHLYYARKSFYVFHLDTPQARRRIDRLLRNSLTLFKKWKILVQQQEIIRRFEERERRSVINLEELKSTINHAEVFMIADVKKQIEQWTWKSLEQKKVGRLVRPLLSQIERWAYEYLDHYIRRFKKSHYRV